MLQFQAQYPRGIRLFDIEIVVHLVVIVHDLDAERM